jgi:dynein heavy chain, axonemal
MVQHNTVILQGIPDLEPLVMERIFFAHKPQLASVQAQEAQVVAVREQVAAHITAALVPVRQFLTKLQEYEPWLRVDAAAYVAVLEVCNSHTDLFDYVQSSTVC